MSHPLSAIQLLVVEQVAKSRERDLLVSAGAGSGKTTILVASVIAALKAGLPLDRILVVTFTDKAAAEMKNKIYREMGAHEDLAPLRLRLPQAWISTIHSFCLRLLRDRFQKAGVDPRFRVLSEEDARLLLADATTRVFHGHYESESKEGSEDTFGRLVEMCGFGPDGENLRGVVHSLLEYARCSEDPDRFLVGHTARLASGPKRLEDLVWSGDYTERIGRAWRYAAGMLRAIVAETGDAAAWTQRLRAIEAVDAGLLATPAGQRAVLEQLAAEGAIESATSFKMRLPNVPKGLSDRLKKFREATKKAFDSDWLTEMPLDVERVLLDERCASRYGLALIRLTEEVAKAYEEAKSRAGRLDFEDLQIKALRLIDGANEESAIRFDRVFIDEFQDVNGLQHQILKRICDPSRIFRVGDVKQSIYQFRLAEPGIIRDLGRNRPLVEERKPAPDDEPEWNVLLPRNHRSLPPVLDVVNAVARNLFFEEEIGTDYERQKLVPGDSTPRKGPDAELILISEEIASGGEEEDDGEQATSVDLHDAEWSAIAKRILELVQSGDQVRDPANGTMRRIAYSDIAILLRAHANAPALARRLEEDGIPCSTGTGESFFEAAEVRDITSILRAVDNMLDDIAVASALRSPAFGWDDTEILSIRLAYPRALHLTFSLARLADGGTEEGGYARALLPEEEESRAVLCGEAAALPDVPPFSTLQSKSRAALDRFLGWRNAAGTSELPDLVSRVLEEAGLIKSMASLPGGLRRQANLRKFVGIARRYARDTGHSLNRFIRWLDLLKESGAKVFEAPVSSESLPAVRILSIHKAKGLEFPVVIVAEMGRRYQLGKKLDALIPGRRYLGVRLLDQESYILRRPAPLRLLRESARADDLAEEKRVLYVALTRARDLLILSGVLSKQTAIPETHHRAFRSATANRDATGKATIDGLLEAKPFPLSWVLYTLPEMPLADGRIGDLPFQVRWIRPEPRENLPAAANRIRDIEPSLRRREQVEVPDGPDEEGERAIARTIARPLLPSPGLLASARGKIWATEFKGGRDEEAVIDSHGAAEETPDEPAAPLIARDAAAREGTLLHAVLERIDLVGMGAANVEERIAAAAQAVGGIPEDAARTLAEGLSRLIELPIGRILASGAEVHREVAFSLRLPLIEVARWLPQLRDEFLASDDWSEWVEEDGTGALRILPGKPAAAGEPWVLVQGRIDAILRGPDGWIVLDWKSDRVADGGTIEKRTEIYKSQMEIYRRAARGLFGSPVRAAVYFLRPGILREVS